MAYRWKGQVWKTEKEKKKMSSPIVTEGYEFLKNHIKGNLLTYDCSLGMYATDASIYQFIPLAIVLPKDSEKVEEIPSGSCGMAGSFGYEKGHF